MAASVSPAGAQTLVREVRAAISRRDFAAGERLIGGYRQTKGVTAEMLEAQSWLARGALAERDLDRAESYAVKTHEEALEMLKSRRLDDDNVLPIALGAAIEVQGQALAARGERSAAIAFLQGELKTYWSTSIRTRIQKNINLLTLEGRPAPELHMEEWIGARPAALDQWHGKPLLLFFWAHWCPDCKSQAPVLAGGARYWRPRGHPGSGPRLPFASRGRARGAGRDAELAYIDEVRRKSYADLAAMAVPVGEENFRVYGASTTPTLVLVDRTGIVRLYHPGQLDYDQLAPRVRAVVD